MDRDTEAPGARELGGPRPFTTTLRVRYAETDQMGVVYHANYFAWFEVGRAELMRGLGLEYRALEMEEGCVLPVVEVSCRYRQPARYDDALVVETRVLAFRGPVMRFGYRLLRDGVLLAEAETKHVVVAKDGLGVRRLPGRYAEALRRAASSSVAVAEEGEAD